MHYCSHCGTQLAPDACFCSKCGQPVEQQTNTVPAPQSEASCWPFAILSFFFPIIGLILYLVWHDSIPKRATYCGVGALIGICLPVLLLTFLLAILIFILALGF